MHVSQLPSNHQPASQSSHTVTAILSVALII